MLRGQGYRWKRHLSGPDATSPLFWVQPLRPAYRDQGPLHPGPLQKRAKEIHVDSYPPWLPWLVGGRVLFAVCYTYAFILRI